MEYALNNIREVPIAVSWFQIAMWAILPVVGGLLVWLKRAFDFHDKYFVRRRLERLSELTGLIDTGDPASNFFKEQLRNEAFRVSTGISTAPRKMEALTTLYCAGFWTVGEIRSVHRYLAVDEQSLLPVLRFSTADVVGARGELVFAIIIIVVGALSLYKLVSFNSGVATLAGFCVFLIYFITGLAVSAGYRKYRAALKIKSFLERNPRIFPGFHCT